MPNIANHILAVPRCTYFIALLDFGPKLGIGPSLSSGTPEATRSDIVKEVRDHIVRDRLVVHVRRIDGTDMEDITAEIIEEALATPIEADEIDLQAIRFDRAYDLRKHAERV